MKNHPAPQPLRAERKRKMKRLFSKALVCLTAVTLLTLGLAAGVSALESKVVLDGTGDIVFVPENDLFTGLKNLMPGDTESQIITIGNDYRKKVRLYLRVEPADFPFTQARELSQKLLDELDLTLTLSRSGAKDAELYHGPASGGPEKDIALGTFSKGAQATLTATVTVPETLGNEFQDAAGKVKWVFYCEEVVTSTSSDDPWEEPEDRPAFGPMRMPETGGFPIEALLPLGTLALIGGLALAKKKK